MILQISCAHLVRVHSPLMEVEDEDSANHTARHHHLEKETLFFYMNNYHYCKNYKFSPIKLLILPRCNNET